MNKIIIIGLMFTYIAVLGCSPMERRMAKLDANRGYSYETIYFSQLRNPNAGKNSEFNESMDGIIADHIIKKYQADYKLEIPPTPILNLNIDND